MYPNVILMVAQKGLEGLAQVGSPALPPAPLSGGTMLTLPAQTKQRTSVSFPELWTGRG